MRGEKAVKSRGERVCGARRLRNREESGIAGRENRRIARERVYGERKP